MPFLKPSDIIALSENGIKSLEEIAGLCTDEFFDIVPNIALTKDQIDSVILESRKKIGWL